MNKYIPVEGHPGFVRDKTSGAILNTNTSEMQNARKAKRAWKEREEELNSLREDVAAMKTMLAQLIEK